MILPSLNILFLGSYNHGNNEHKLCYDFKEIIPPENLEIKLYTKPKIPDFIIVDDTILDISKPKIILLRDLPNIRSNLLVCPSYENFKLRTLF